jgi:hypothetical protein
MDHRYARIQIVSMWVSSGHVPQWSGEAIRRVD